MGIDGIGKGGRVPPPAGGGGEISGPKGAEKAAETGRAFDVRGPAEKTPAQNTQNARDVGAVERTPLERLRAGEIDVNGYVDIKVDAATRHLQGLGKVELEHIRATLRHQMANDPAILDLVKQAAGSAPTSRDE
jgi:hypothetical protein